MRERESGKYEGARKAVSMSRGSSVKQRAGGRKRQWADTSRPSSDPPALTLGRWSKRRRTSCAMSTSCASVIPSLLPYLSDKSVRCLVRTAKGCRDALLVLVTHVRCGPSQKTAKVGAQKVQLAYFARGWEADRGRILWDCGMVVRESSLPAYLSQVCACLLYVLAHLC